MVYAGLQQNKSCLLCFYVEQSKFLFRSYFNALHQPTRLVVKSIKMEEDDGLIGSLVYSDSEESVTETSPAKLSPSKSAENVSEDSDVPVGKAKKAVRNILSSEDENKDEVQENNEVPNNAIDAKSSEDEVEITEKNEKQKQRKKKVLKSRKELNKKIVNKSQSSGTSSSSEDENEEEQTSDKKTTKKPSDNLCDEDSSMSSNSEQEPYDAEAPLPIREKHTQRVSSCGS